MIHQCYVSIEVNTFLKKIYGKLWWLPEYSLVTQVTNSFLIIACLISWIYTGKLSHQFTYIYVKLNPSINEFWFCHMIHDTYKKLDKRDERLKIWFLSQLFPSCYECRIIFKIFKRNCLISDCFVKSIFFFVCALATCTCTLCTKSMIVMLRII